MLCLHIISYQKNEEILKTDLMEVSGAGSSVIKELVDKDIFIESDKTISRLKTWNNKLSDLPQLSDTQRSCINEMDKFLMQEIISYYME